jgi:hypothetical protein
MSLDGKESDVYMSLNKDKPVFVALIIVLRRAFMNLIRQPLLLSSRVSQGLSYALILCAFYAPLGSNQAAVQNIIGNLHELTAICFIGMLTCIAVFPLERDVFYREYMDGGYSSMAFLLSYYILSLPTLLFSSIIVSVLVTYAIGLNGSLYGFLIFTYVIGCFLFVGECIGVIFSAIFLNVGVSVNAMSLVIACFCKYTIHNNAIPYHLLII